MSDEHAPLNNADSIRRAMQPVAQVLESLNIVYAVVGSVAGLSHGYGRCTIAVDVLVQIEMSHVAPLVELLNDGRYFVDDAMIRDAIRHQHSFNLYHFETGMKIDIFVSKSRPFDLQVLARREVETMNDQVTAAFQVQTAEDLVLSKLQWFHLGNCISDRQWNDILAVLKINEFAVDLDYLTHWAQELKISDLLERALDEAGFNDA